MRIRSLLAVIAAAALAVTGLQFVSTAQTADAANAAQFDPGMIISDALFYDGGAMSADQVQNFLNSKVSNCASGYTCLKDYHQDTTTRPAEASNCATYTGAANESAATIIARVGSVCGISQKVLLVLLQKEQSLVTRTSPTDSTYRSATGYGCPDTAACDSLFYGFFNQVYMAALQFKRYAANPTHWSYVAGRVNSIRYSPNAACGSGAVFVQNNATAGLYDYTPYQPNGPALANLYGTGDGCSSYGNRNFWTFYTDWFGSTTAYSLMRTTDNPLVYLVAGTTKYPVTSYAIFQAYAALGGVSFVSQSFLDALTTGVVAGRIIRGSDGGIYFIDASIKTQFTSCQMVVDYGGSCNSDGYVQLTDAQIAAFHTGPYATQVLATVQGGRYMLDDGSKREVLDDQAQAAAGLAPGFNVLTEAAVADRPYGTPILSDGAFVGTTGTSSVSYTDGQAIAPIPPGDPTAMGASARIAGSIHAESIALLPSAPVFTGLVKAAGSADVQILTSAGRLHVTQPALAQSSPVTQVPQSVLDGYPDAGALSATTFVKSPSDATVYVVTATSLRPVAGWDTLVTLAGNSNPNIVTVPGSILSAMPKGAAALSPGMMYRSTANPQIYLIDGPSGRIPVGSFDVSAAMGFTKWTTQTQAALDGYTSNASSLGYGITCGTTNYVAAGGKLHAVTTTTQPLYPFSYLALDASTCALMTIGAPAPGYIRTSDGSIFQLVGGQKVHLTYAAYTANLPASGTWMSVTDGFADGIPSSPAS